MPQTGINSLSGKEIKFIEHIGKGFSSEEITILLAISLQEIMQQKKRIIKKLLLKDAAALDDYLVHAQLELEERAA